MGWLTTYRRRRTLRRLYGAIESSDLSAARSLLADLHAAEQLAPHAGDILLATCQAGAAPGVVEDLLRLCPSALDTRDARGRHALHVAVENGDEETVAVLLEAGADPNVQDADGVTALNLCKSFHGTGTIINRLQAAGADPMVLDKHGKNYLM